MTRSSCRGGIVVVTNREWTRATVSVAGAARDEREVLVGLERVEDRLVPLVDLGVAGDPRPHRGPAGDVGGQRIQRLGRRAHLPGDLAGEVPEHVLLAGEVLVEGHARAASELGDPVDAAAVVALLTEGTQRGVEDALLRPLPPGPDPGVVGEGGAAHDRDGAVGSGRLARRRASGCDTTVSRPPVSSSPPWALHSDRCYRPVTQVLVHGRHAATTRPTGATTRWRPTLRTDRARRLGSRLRLLGGRRRLRRRRGGGVRHARSGAPSISASTASTPPRATAWAPRSARSGEALGSRRDEAIVVTKFGMNYRDKPNLRDSSRERVLASIDKSLKNLGTDYVDVYLVHWPDRETPFEETMTALDDVVRDGKVRHVGALELQAGRDRGVHGDPPRRRRAVRLEHVRPPHAARHPSPTARSTASASWPTGRWRSAC